jgi:mycothiol synthase
MDNLSGDFLIRHPSIDDAQATLGLMIAYDVAEFGEPDSSLEDLLDQWSDVDLDQDAWLVVDPQNQPVGYAAVFGNNNQYTFDHYVHPTLAPDGLTKYLLEHCEARTLVKQKEIAGGQATATIVISESKPVNIQVVQALGYQPYKYHFGMRINFDAPPSAPVWPEGITLRTAIPGQDDRLLYDFIQAAFARPDRKPPSFERWRNFMMGASNFKSDLWFLIYHGDELIAAALCFDYPERGWVRQLGVAQQWRRHGIASTLLQYIFSVFYKRGHAQVGLVVESENPKAYKLYESVGMKRVMQIAEYSKILTDS